MQTEVQHIQLSHVDEQVEQQSQAQTTRRVRSQFEKPTGLRGRVVGWLMAHRASNRERNAWAVSLLELQSTDHVLEIGFGPGIAIALMSKVVTSGQVVGIDHSEVMLQQAGKRNASVIEQGRVQLRLASASELPVGHDRYDKCLMVNTFHYWDNPNDVLRNVQGLMKPGGKIVVAFQPRLQGTTGEGTLKVGYTMVERLKAAGFSRALLEVKSLVPESVVCAVGMKEG
ncbi:MAG TPA: class I SAM-dependent methyltransferase [Nitrospira sp.]|nr:class I SAM-dependent methyltransferase [Nitrospira sp.]